MILKMSNIDLMECRPLLLELNRISINEISEAENKSQKWSINSIDISK